MLLAVAALGAVGGLVSFYYGRSWALPSPPYHSPTAPKQEAIRRLARELLPEGGGALEEGAAALQAIGCAAGPTGYRGPPASHHDVLPFRSRLPV